MIDLHTHLLPDWDDGASNWEEAAKMLDLVRGQGIRGIALTPHIGRLSKHDDNWELLAERKAEFERRMGGNSVQIYFGAEVHIHPEMIQTIKENDLTLNGSRYVFIEFPADHVLATARNLIFKMMCEDLVPIISHPERNIVFAKRPERLHELVSMGALCQLTAQSLTGGFGPEIQKTAELFLRHNLVQIIASDAHDARLRPPRLTEAAVRAAKIVGPVHAATLVTSIPEAILRNEEIPDFGAVDRQ